MRIYSPLSIYSVFSCYSSCTHTVACVYTAAGVTVALMGSFLVTEKKDLKALFCFFSSPFVVLPCQKDTCKLLLSVEHASIFSFTVFVLLYSFTVSFTVQTLCDYMQDATI